MPVTSKHPEYTYHAPDWRRCRDVYNGQRAVKVAGPLYLPKLSEQSNHEYGAYKQRALFYSITSKSVGALVGMGTYRPPVLKYPDSMKSHFEENSGIQFHEALGATISEILLMGRYGILVDRQAEGGKPELHGYRTESIINWQENRDGKPFLVVLCENVYGEVVGDEFERLSRKQYRVLRLVPKDRVMTSALSKGLISDTSPLPIVNEAGSGWIYTVSIYDEKDQHVKTVVPTNTGRPMNVIPFYVGTPFGISLSVCKSPMLDIADINVSHYCSSADLEHGRHFTGLPTPVVTGVDINTKMKIGSLIAWVLPDKDADAKYLEFTGQGLASLENAMKEKERQMATLSSRLMDNSANGSEAADAIKLRYMSESASLSSVVRTAEAILNLAYKTMAAMEDIDPDEVNITLEKDFNNVRLSASDVLKLTESYLTGGMTVESYVYNLRRGDQIPVTRTDAEEIASLEATKKALEVANAAKQQTPPKTKPPAQ